MKTHKIGCEYMIGDKLYILVSGDKCSKCHLNDKPECKLVPECDTHFGHYELKISECKYSKLITNLQNNCKSEKDYYLFTEVFCELHNGSDICNCNINDITPFVKFNFYELDVQKLRKTLTDAEFRRTLKMQLVK